MWVLSDFIRVGLPDSCFMLVLGDLMDWELSFCSQACWFKGIFWLESCINVRRHVDFKEFHSSGALVFVHRHVGFKRFHCLGALLLCTCMSVLSDFIVGRSIFVHRHVGFKRFHGLGVLLLCAGMWALSDLMEDY